MQYLGFDTGVTTGWSIIEVTDEDIKLSLSGQTTDLVGWLVENHIHVDAIVYESFILRRGAFTSDQISPVYGIGAIQHYARLYNVPTFEVTPAQSKGSVDNERLKALGLYGAAGHANRHQRDASRVIVQHLLRTRNKTLLRKWRGQ